MSSLHRVVIVIGLAACTAPRSPAPPPRTEVRDRRVTNLRALARLYGPLRWFHPSDQVAALDWDRFTVAAVTRVRDAASTDQLAAALTELVAPIAPTVTISRAGRPPPPVPRGRAGQVEVSWQHLGAGLGEPGRFYSSHRRNRSEQVADRSSGQAVSQVVDAAALRGRTVRLRLWLRSDGIGEARAWLRVDREGDAMSRLENMADAPITATDWTEVTLTTEVAADAARLVVGVLLLGPGATWYDDARLEVGDGAGGWSPVPLGNGDFEAPLLTPWTFPNYGYRVERVAQGRTGHGLLVQATTTTIDHDLFPEHARIGQVATLDLGDGLVAHLPLVVWSQAGHTVPDPDRAAVAALDAALAAAPTDAADPAVQVAGLIVTWNVFRHFYPYLDVIDESWPAVLDDALLDAADDRDRLDQRHTLMRLLHRSHDGHARVSPQLPDQGWAPVTLAWVEEQLVVAASADPGLRRGDVITALDGVPAARALAEAEALHAGSPQWQRVRALRNLTVGPRGSAARFAVEREAGVEEVAVTRTNFAAPPVFDRPPLFELESGVWYVDLSRAPWDDIEPRLAELAAARGVVFDVRARPRDNYQVLRHLLRRPDDVDWMHVAHLVDPDPAAVTAWEHRGWHLTPAEPRFTGTVVFVTGPTAISYAESVMAYVEYHGLPIVGAPTAGANGNVRRFEVPSGEEVTFTAMRVTRHDGGQHHLRGVRPTIEAAPTVAGLRAGRNQVLERAVAEVRRRAGAGDRATVER